MNSRIVKAGCEEAALIGNAILGYTFQKEFSSVEEASKSMVSRGDLILPKDDWCAEYQRNFEFYKMLYSGMHDLYAKHAEFEEERRKN